MGKRITDINIIQQFTNNLTEKTYGVYQCKFNGEDRIFVRNGDKVYALTHLLEDSKLLPVRDDVQRELLGLLYLEGVSCCVNQVGECN